MDITFDQIGRAFTIFMCLGMVVFYIWVGYIVVTPSKWDLQCKERCGGTIVLFCGSGSIAHSRGTGHRHMLAICESGNDVVLKEWRLDK